MLERLLSFWKGKLFVLALLGFAATDFIITMTLSAADASAHLIENPNLRPTLAGHQVAITLVLLALLGAVFLRGFTEAIGLAVGAGRRLPRPQRRGHRRSASGRSPRTRTSCPDWTARPDPQHGNPLAMVGVVADRLPQARPRACPASRPGSR